MVGEVSFPFLGELMGSTCHRESAGLDWHWLWHSCTCQEQMPANLWQCQRKQWFKNSGTLCTLYFTAVPWVSALGISSHPCYWERCACFCSTAWFSFSFYICYIISLRMMFGLCWMHTWWNYSFEFFISVPINNIPWQHPAFFPSERVNGFRDWVAVKTHRWPWNRCSFNNRSTSLGFFFHFVAFCPTNLSKPEP